MQKLAGTGVLQQLTQHDVGIEEDFSHPLSLPFMSMVLGFDGYDGLRSLLKTGECENSFPSRYSMAETCVLNNHWSASSQVAGRAATKPTAPHGYVNLLRNG